jgi:hypothetical protein
VPERVLLVGGGGRTPPLPVSTSEWMPSATIAELPVRPAATNLMIATMRLPTTAATTAILDPPLPAMLYAPVL